VWSGRLPRLKPQYLVQRQQRRLLDVREPVGFPGRFRTKANRTAGAAWSSFRYWLPVV
jgi:hypothetical protein